MVSFTGASFQRWSTLQRPRHTEVLTRLFVLLCFNILGLDLKLTAKWPKQTQKGWIKGFINGSPFEPDEFSPTCELLIFISHRVQIFFFSFDFGPQARALFRLECYYFDAKNSKIFKILAFEWVIYFWSFEWISAMALPSGAKNLLCSRYLDWASWFVSKKEIKVKFK